jgi:hypothetical protein
MLLTAKTEYLADKARLQEAIKNIVRVYVEIPRICYQIRSPNCHPLLPKKTLTF